MSPEFTFWYQREIKAKNLIEALKQEKKVKIERHSIDENDNCDRELTSCIGFSAYDDEYEED